MKKVLLVLLVLGLWNGYSLAAVTLLDKDQWKISLGGFAELDIFTDTSRSFRETLGSNPVARRGTLSGDNGRTQFSIRNSRFSFGLIAPTVEEWKSRGYLEFDLLGIDNYGTEASLFTAPTVRLRHAYFTAENDGWQLWAGQFWTLFGWQTQFLPPTVAVAPITGVTYQRTPQVTVVKTMTNLQAGVSIARPTQADSQLPNLDLGVRYLFSDWKTPFQNSSSGDVMLQAASVALTGTVRDVETPNNGPSSDKVHYTAYGAAFDGMFPLLGGAKKEGSYGHSLLLFGEVTAGQGYGDMFTAWSGNVAKQESKDTSFASTSLNLVPGVGGFDSAGAFHLVQLVTANVVVQFHFPEEDHTWLNVGYGRLASANAAGLKPLVTGATSYDRTETLFGNIYHDFSKQIRAAFEYSFARTHYSDNMMTQNSRFQLSAWFRF